MFESMPTSMIVLCVCVAAVVLFLTGYTCAEYAYDKKKAAEKAYSDRVAKQLQEGQLRAKMECAEISLYALEKKAREEKRQRDILATRVSSLEEWVKDISTLREDSEVRFKELVDYSLTTRSIVSDLGAKVSAKPKRARTF